MVCGILVSVRVPVGLCAERLVQTYKFGANFAYITLLTMAGYAWFTIRTTAWR